MKKKITCMSISLEGIVKIENRKDNYKGRRSMFYLMKYRIVIQEFCEAFQSFHFNFTKLGK